MAVKHFYGQDASKPASNFRLAHVAKIKQLADNRLIGEEGVSELGKTEKKTVISIILKFSNFGQ